MGLISDILLAAGAFGAAIYCVVLSRRLRAFNQLENGMGGAIAVLSAQVDDMTRALEKAQKAANSSVSDLRSLTERAESGAERLEIMLASLHDLPDTSSDDARKPRVVRRRARETDMEAVE
ncbi:hypothetical protein ERN12_11105 [Rhodobacteraceae bacterium]|nr:hypothetical protein ERN12_11105 [Paracoccaceae bacterium]